jgi:hypothetical protein
VTNDTAETSELESARSLPLLHLSGVGFHALCGSLTQFGMDQFTANQPTAAAQSLDTHAEKMGSIGTWGLVPMVVADNLVVVWGYGGCCSGGQVAAGDLMGTRISLWEEDGGSGGERMGLRIPQRRRMYNSSGDLGTRHVIHPKCIYNF